MKIKKRERDNCNST